MLKTTPEQRARLRENHRDSAVMRIEHAMDLLDDVETLLGSLRFIAFEAAGLCSCCLDDALNCVEPHRSREVAEYLAEHGDCYNARCAACHALGHPDPCKGPLTPEEPGES